jgi:predicted HD superfamily hydrolase involved in NAD metabolism
VPYIQGIELTGDIRADMTRLLTHHGYLKTVGHCVRVAAKAKQLATRFGQDEGKAEIAGWLHDISAMIPLERRVTLAQQLGLEVLAEEVALPMILHQKLSAVMAREIFQIHDEPTLSAIGCHTTLKVDASALDKIVFVADKIAWDGEGDPPYLSSILAAVERSLNQAAWCYLDYLWQRRESLAIVHPWFVEAYQQLSLRAPEGRGAVPSAQSPSDTRGLLRALRSPSSTQDFPASCPCAAQSADGPLGAAPLRRKIFSALV